MSHSISCCLWKVPALGTSYSPHMLGAPPRCLKPADLLEREQRCCEPALKAARSGGAGREDQQLMDRCYSAGVSMMMITVTQALASLLHWQLQGQQRSGCGANPAKTVSFALTSAQSWRLGGAKPKLNLCGDTWGVKPRNFILNRKEELERVWHRFATPWLCFPDCIAKVAPQNLRVGAGGT